MTHLFCCKCLAFGKTLEYYAPKLEYRIINYLMNLLIEIRVVSYIIVIMDTIGVWDDKFLSHNN